VGVHLLEVCVGHLTLGRSEIRTTSEIS